MIELTFREGVKLRRSLRMAFRSRSALTQVVFDQLREDLGQLAGDGDYSEILIKLIVWAEVNSRTIDLIQGARAGNPSDDLLREFEIEYQAQRQHIGGVSGLPPRVLTQALRQQLVDAVMAIPTSETFQGRTSYLIGLPGAPSRIPDNAPADLNTIFNQLDGLGQMEHSKQWPLLLVIDNILQYAKGYAIHNVINGIRQALEQSYNIHR